MNTFMHCWYIHSTQNTLNQGFYHSIPLCLQCMNACIADTYTLHQIPWRDGICQYIPMCLQCIHACITDTFTLHWIPWIRVSVIISFFVCNACMHALLIHSTHNKNPESWFCHYILLCLQWIHSCIADTFTLHKIPWIRVFIIVSRCVCNAWMHALLIHTPYTKYPEGMVFVNISQCACNAYMHALLIHSLYTKYPESGFLSLYPFVFAMRALLLHSTRNK